MISNKNEIIFSDKIKINNLSFSYENGKDEVLKNINLEIKNCFNWLLWYKWRWKINIY